MTGASPATRRLARRLLDLEALRDESLAAGSSDVARVCERLRSPLERLAGAEGFRSLLSRALALAKADVPSLAPVRVTSDGTLDGLDRIERDVDADGGAVVVARLLGLLMAFIGEPLTLRLVRDAWPNVSMIEWEADP